MIETMFGSDWTLYWAFGNKDTPMEDSKVMEFMKTAEKLQVTVTADVETIGSVF